MLRGRVALSDTRYRDALGRAPRGTARWMFTLVYDDERGRVEFVSDEVEWREARADALYFARGQGARSVEVEPPVGGEGD